MSLRVLFYQPNHVGHHLSYFSRMLPGFCELPLTIGMATTKAAVVSDEFQKQLQPFQDRIEVLECCKPTPSGQLRIAWQRCREVREIAKNWKADHVCILYADGLWQMAALHPKLFPSRVSVEGWFYRGGFSYDDARGRSDRLKRFLFGKLLGRSVFSKIHCQDELLCEYAKKLADLKSSRTKVVLTVDPLYIPDDMGVSKSSARAAMGMPEDGILLSTSGMIDRRKGADLAIRAFVELLERHTNEFDQPLRMLVAGPHDEAIRQMLKDPSLEKLLSQNILVSHDRYLNEEDMWKVAVASDLVLATYPNHSGRSSIMLWGSAAGKPVLGADRGCIGHVIRTENLGHTCNVKDREALVAAMKNALLAPWTSADADRVRNYAVWHKSENYQEISSSLVRERCDDRSKDV